MAIQWNWNEKIGELLIRQKDQEFTLSIYQGNALAIFLYEFTDEKDGTGRYNMYQFFGDKEHFKNCTKNKEWNYAEEWVRITMNKVPTDFWIILKDLAKRGVEIIINSST